MRLLLEPEAVRLATREQTDETVAACHAALADAADAAEHGEVADISLANRRFHRSLYLPCPNNVLVEFLDAIQDRVAMISVSAWRRDATWSNEADEHAAILAAVTARDGEHASALLTRSHRALPAGSRQRGHRSNCGGGVRVVRQIAELLGTPPRAGMLPNFILSRVAELERRPQRRSDDEIRSRLRDALGIDRLPREDAQRSIGTIDRGDFVIEKLVYEATPGLPVPAHLYLPAAPGPHPAVVHPPGHWMENAKIEVVQQQFNAHLARNGVAVLVYDTLGQGERRVGWHQHGQLAPLLAGFTSIGLMVRDSLAALGLLAARDDIDASRLGMTGTSGGGWSTMFAAALDDRIAVAAIACIVNTHLSQMRDAGFGTGWDGWTDLCIQVPGICDIGTIAEIYACVAPRALRIVHAREDPPFPLAGAREVAGGVAKLFAARGAGDAFSFVDVPGGHGLHPAVRRRPLRRDRAPPARGRADTGTRCRVARHAMGGSAQPRASGAADVKTLPGCPTSGIACRRRWTRTDQW